MFAFPKPVEEPEAAPVVAATASPDTTASADSLVAAATPDTASTAAADTIEPAPDDSGGIEPPPLPYQIEPDTTGQDSTSASPAPPSPDSGIEGASDEQ